MIAERWKPLPDLPPPGRLRVANVLALYRVRLRHRWPQELLAIAGIAVGVALLFASQVANTSLSGPVHQLTRGIVGTSQLAAVGRGPDGFDAAAFAEVSRLPGVRRAAPVLQAQAEIVGPRGARALTVFGADPRIVRLRGTLLQGFSADDAAREQALILPARIARTLGVRFGDHVSLHIAGRTVRTQVATAGRDAIGVLSDTTIALAPLAYLQRVTGLRGRVSRILVEAQPGAVDDVAASMRRIAGGRFAVTPADQEARMFEKAAEPISQATTISSAVGALVGFLFAFCALLVTAASRRALALDLRLDGYTPRRVVAVVLLDAAILGVVASAAGLALGELLSRRGFGTDVSYLAGAFPMGDQRVVTASSVMIAVGGGLLAAALGVLAPLRATLAPPRREPARPGRRHRPWEAATGVALVAAAAAVTVFAPNAALAGLIALGLGLILLVPAFLGAVIGALTRLNARRARVVVAVQLALPHLQAPEWRARTLAIATTGAVAVFGAVALQGARANLQDGLFAVAPALDDAADVWVLPRGAGDLFGTTAVPDRSALLRSVPGVRAVNAYRAGFLDVGDRRVLVFAPPATDPEPVPSAQVRTGDRRALTARVRSGRWVTLSRALADALHVGVGDRVTLPTPRPATVRVAAITTNLGWTGGVVFLDAAAYARAWGTRAVGAYEVRVAGGAAGANAAARRIAAALGPRSALRVETAQARAVRQRTVIGSGLSRLRQVASLTLLAAVLAMAAAMAGLLWQRRPAVARQKLDGHGTGLMWRSLLAESATLFGTGCLAGALFGLLGQILFSRGLEIISGFPVELGVRPGIAAASLGLVVGAALAVVAVPGYLVARVQPSLRGEG
ncbi:MAG TPA: FtsX-like permease family protein [Baekduia sp.]|uniref:ABC transporter permease n=1 Tax=Baekduia sp. TaxID=2600305 RepID=UPI002D79085F|nr:FtsX-like permease family protein [Baekduia sp.]HET6509550.1 FtsX-like permease family protein [Baekduia sp.]